QINVAHHSGGIHRSSGNYSPYGCRQFLLLASYKTSYWAREAHLRPLAGYSGPGTAVIITPHRAFFLPHFTNRDILIDGKKDYVSLEPVSTTSDVKPRAIPCGTYPVRIRKSKKFKREMPHIDEVPGFEGIEIHTGNFPHQTLGCVLIGQYAGPQPDF